MKDAVLAEWLWLRILVDIRDSSSFSWIVDVVHYNGVYVLTSCQRTGRRCNFQVQQKLLLIGLFFQLLCSQNSGVGYDGVIKVVALVYIREMFGWKKKILASNGSSLMYSMKNMIMALTWCIKFMY